MKEWRVLVFPGGTEIGLEIQKALSPCKEVRLFSAGMNVPNHAPYVFLRHFVLPSVHERGWLEALIAVVRREGIDFIFPAYDDVLLALAENANRIPATVVTSPLETCRITRSKSATYRFLEGVVPVPRMYPDADSVDAFPVFVKPDRGQGSQRAALVPSKAELAELVKAQSDLIILENLPGEEYTVDCFSDRERGLLFCGARQRIRTNRGIAWNSRPVRDPAFDALARGIAGRLEFHGVWFFQAKRAADGVLTLLEIAPRVAGTMALHRVMGVNFPLLSLYEQARVPVTIMANEIDVELERALLNRYRHDLRYGAVFVDLDDTLLCHGVVNRDLVKLVFQCINAGVRTVLLTRHAGDLNALLAKHRLAGLWDEIIAVDKDRKKSEFITRRDAILVDDSFSERADVQRRCGIPTFDSSMIEMLFDDRA